MAEPKLTIVISAHDPKRPVQRAVDSVLDCEDAKALVVAHNLEPSALNLRPDPRLEIIQVSGGKGFPGVPANAGFNAVTSEFTGKLDSDDYFNPGALDAMLNRIQTDKSDAVIAPYHVQGKRNITLLRTFRSKNLKADRDRLFYRTAPFGIFRTKHMKAALPFNSELFTGEDIRVTAKLWTSGMKISYHRKDPSYFLSNEAPDRASTAVRPLKESGEAWLKIWNEKFTHDWSPSLKKALAIKLVRANLIQVLIRDQASLTKDDLDWVNGLLQTLDTNAPSWQKALEGSELEILEALRKNQVVSVKQTLARGNTAFKFSIVKAVLHRDSLSRWQIDKKLGEYLAGLQTRLKVS